MTELTEQERKLLSVIRESTEDAMERGRSEAKQKSQAFLDDIGKDHKDHNTNQEKETSLKRDFKNIFAPWLETQLDARVPDWVGKVNKLYERAINKPKFTVDGKPLWDTLVFQKVINEFHTEIFNNMDNETNFGRLFRPIQRSRTTGAAHEHTHDDKAIQTLANNYIRFLKPLNIKPTDRMLQYSEGKDPLLTKIEDFKTISEQNTERSTDDTTRGPYNEDLKPAPGGSTSSHHLEQDIHQETDALDCESPSAIDDTAHDQEIDAIAESIIETPVIERVQVPSIEDEYSGTPNGYRWSWTCKPRFVDLADSDAIALAPDSLVSLKRAGAGISDTLEKPNFEISESMTIKKLLIAICLLVVILFPVIYAMNAVSGPTVNQITASWEQYRINAVGPTFEEPVSESNVASFYSEQLELVDMEQYQEAMRLADFLSFWTYSNKATIYACVCYRQAANVAEDKPKRDAAFETARLVLNNSEGVLSDTEKKRYLDKLEDEVQAYAVASEPGSRYSK